MILSNEQKISYLTNIILIAKSDGTLSAIERAAIESIQKAIGARKTELNKAFKLSESETSIIPVGSWSDKIKNLEDIIYVSMVDEVIDKKEKELLLGFASKIEISQAQLKIIINDVRKYLSASSMVTLCRSCKAEVSQTSKFCPGCGKPVDEVIQSNVETTYQIPTEGITIEFASSSASGFASASEEYKKAPIHGTCVKGKTTWYMASWMKRDILHSIKLIECLKGMRNRKVYVDGKDEPWHDALGFLHCAASRRTSYRPDSYCFGVDDDRINICGCQHGRMEWERWNDWFGYGSFKEKGMFLKNNHVFVFDKKRIRHEIEKNLYRYRLCPHLQFNLIEEVIKNIPDEVSPSQNGEWRYRENNNDAIGAVHVKIKVSEGGHTYYNEFYSSAVEPISNNTCIEILKKSFKKCAGQSRNLSVLSYKGN